MVEIDFTLTPEEQIAYLKSKGVSANWKDVFGEAHHKVFTVAGVTKSYILRAIRDEIAKSLGQDLSFAEARERIISKVKDGDFFPDHRLRFIFSQNMYGANGRVKCQKQMKSSLPYIQYVHSRSMGGKLKPNYRERHWKAHGLVFRKDDPWLKKNMPPNGFGCRCTTRAISSYRLKKEGLKVQESDKTETVAEEGFDYNMCGDEMEHIEKVESIERKRAEKGDKISQLALFENLYKRVQHFQELCENRDGEEVQKNAEKKNGDCNRDFELIKLHEKIQQEKDKSLKLGMIKTVSAQKIFLPETREELTKEEQMFVNSWSGGGYHAIRSIFAKEFINLTKKEERYKKKAETLQKMFAKYKSKHPLDQTTFRGFKFNKNDLSDIEKYKTLSAKLTSKSAFVLDKAPSSTSKNIRIARDFANADVNTHHSIIVLFQQRVSDEIDISKVSSADEDEIIIQAKLNYKTIKYSNINGVLYAVIEEVL